MRASVRAPYGRLQQHLDGEIERRPRLLEVPEAELPLAGGKMALRLGNQVGNRILDRDRLRLRGLPRPAGAGGVTVTWTGFGPLPHPTIDTLTPIAAATGSSVR